MYLISVIRSALAAFRVHVARKQVFYRVLAALGIIAFIALFLLLSPPADFPRGAALTVPEHANLGAVSAELEARGLIRSAFLFKAVGRVMRADTRIKAGEYRFDEPQGMTHILYRLEAGISGLPTYRVTFPEGITVREMTEILDETVPGFDASAFRALAEPSEGYLFPDTYLLEEGTTPEELIERMRGRFDEVWEEVHGEAEARYEDGSLAPMEPQHRIVIMASILEKETKPGVDRNIVSGILWDRIAYGMPLQVDAVFGYIKGIDTFHPSGKDLELDSPYNTYRYRDLPPGPIGNPGRDALESAFWPRLSNYTYYLFGNDGQMHYAETFEEHKANKERYLR